MLRPAGLRRTNWSRAFAVFALLAFAVRALTPDGYMLSPAAEPGRFIEVTLCAAHGGAVQAVLDRHTGQVLPGDTDAPRPQSDENTGKPGGACVFAAAAHVGSPESAPSLAKPSTRVQAVRFSVREAFTARGLAAPPPWSTGPPQAA